MNFKEADTIHQKCEALDIKKYVITENGVDVFTDVAITNQQLVEFPFEFNEIHGWFFCDNNSIKTLKKGPKIVHGAFICEHNELTSLEYFPKSIGLWVNSRGNNIVPWNLRYVLFSKIVHPKNRFLNDTVDEMLNKYFSYSEKIRREKIFEILSKLKEMS